MNSPASYRVVYTPAAARQVRKLPQGAQRRVVGAIGRLQLDPRPPGAKSLRGTGGGLRIRVGEYRVLYAVVDEAVEVHVVKIGHRRDVYDR